jgi:hypothetical protein
MPLLPPLPARRLVECANGLWDEKYETFYPWKFTSGTVYAKRGIRWYVLECWLTCENHGDCDAGLAYWLTLKDGVAISLIQLAHPKSTAAVGTGQAVNGRSTPHILTDANVNLAYANGAVAKAGGCTYAEVPDDPAEILEVKVDA